MEKKRREDVESQLRDVVSAKTAEETRRSSESVKARRAQLDQAQADIGQVRAELDDNRTSGVKEKEELRHATGLPARHARTGGDALW